MDTAPPFALYNPALLPPDVLLSEFTARRPLLARLLDIIRANDPGEPAQHVLCVGPRGMGKTTLLCAIAATIKLREPELAKHWQPVIFDEESRRIGDLADFWLECIRQWESETEPTLTRSHRIDALLAKPGPDIEDKAREVFLSLVDASGKRALLLIDNLNDIFIAVNDAESLMRLRSFLMSDPRVMIIGAATRWFSDVTGLDKPFFEFFRPFDLHALSLEEMRECLAGVATARGDENVLKALRERPGSIEVLHILTGGNPRLIRTFYRLLNEGMNGELRLQLERLIDDYTPYHKAIIDALPGQQQRVLDAIALEWNPTDVGTVARATRLPSNQVSAQIKALIKAGLISEAANMGHSKKKAYLLTDRFSNIHYLMRHGRTGKLKMHWFVLTLRALFDDDQFVELATHAVRLSNTERRPETMTEAASMAFSAIESAGSEPARRALLDKLTGAPDFDEGIDVEMAENLCLQAITAKPSDAYAHFKLGRLLHVHFGRLPEAVREYLTATHLDPTLMKAWLNLGDVMEALGRQSEAVESYRKCIDIDPHFSSAYIRLARVLMSLDDIAEAVRLLENATLSNPTESSLYLALADTLLGQGRYEEAEAAYRTALHLEPNQYLAWSGLAGLLTLLKRFTEAEEAYRRSLSLSPDQAWSWRALGFLLKNDLHRTVEGEQALNRAQSLDPHYEGVMAALVNIYPKIGGHSPPKEWSVNAVKLSPNNQESRKVFRRNCFANHDDLASIIPEVGLWCSSHPSQRHVHSFMVDAWIAYAKATSASEARELLDAQPDEVKLAFETVRDAFLAHDDKDHLHRLAPERRAPVLKLLERL